MINVVIVEDEKYIIDGLLTLINWNKFGCRVCDTASNGVEAYDKILAKKPDLVISDIKMPYMDGLTLCQKFYKQEYSPKFIFITGYENFEYAKKALNLGALSLVSKMNLIDDLKVSLQETINNHFSLFNEKNINSIRNTILETYFLENKNINRDLYTNYYFQALAVSSNEFEKDSSYYLELLETSLKKDNSSYGFISYLFRKNIFLFIIFSNGMLCKEDCRDFAYRLNTLLKNDILKSNQYTIAVGRILNGIKGCVDSINDTYIILAKRKLMHNKSIIEFENFTTEQDEVVSNFQKDTEIKILQGIETENLDEVKEKSEIWLKYMFEDNNYSLDFLKFSIMTLLSLIIWKIAEKAEQIDFQNIKENLHKIYQANDHLQLKAYFNEYFEKILQIFSNSISSQSGIDIIKDSINYIEKHIFDNITLKKISYYYYLSPAYFSTQFKKVHKCTFSYYLTKCKMERAILLIKQGFSVSKISDLLGYKEVKNFIRSFKKFYGKSPAQYRKDLDL